MSFSQDRPSDATSSPDLAPRLPVLTRRTVVRAGAVLGAAATLGATGPASSALAASGSRRMVVRRSALGPGRTTGPLRAPHRFDLLGAPVRTIAGIGLEVRARPRGGRWSGWQAMSDHDGHAPDGRRAAMSEPLWFGDVDEVELRSSRRPATDVRLDLVAVAPSDKRDAGRASTRAADAGGILAAGRASTRATGGRASTRAGVPTIIPRSAWASGLSPKGSPGIGSVQMAFVHHTVNGNDYGASESAGIVRAIFDYHVRSNGWNDIGYNFLVDRFGQIFEGRAGGIDQAVIGAQAIGWNSVSTGIAIIGTFEGTAAPPAALAAVASIIRWKLPLHGAPTAGTVALVSSGGSGNRYSRGTAVRLNRISGHRDGCSTDCPGTSLYGQLPALRSSVGDVAAGPVAALTIVAAGSAVGYGQDTTVTGRLTNGGSGVGGATVVVEKKSPGGSWVPMTQVTTTADGNWTAGFPLRAASPVRATSGGATSSAVTPVLDPGLGISQPTKYPRTGRDLTVRGTARGVSEVTIVLRRKQGGRYITAARRTAKVKNGRFVGEVPVRRSALHAVYIESKVGGKTFRSSTRGVRSKS
ncbi:N-acetylmuramoyl-L-alanine amidase [Patulibacter sp.]|uniref:N-acetylmuramoyl-L-alanine amidase n=1 Tax=Patulibacter sp. TaxID=1912859 RepID=UPI0027210160|nr:N-acetylmuramoyl-L-alanine amidase [Patulibacter sp.]MDO9408080.1 N-acetylmuramoyl-L-alanine amidase [Patulibacter sp.]